MKRILKLDDDNKRCNLYTDIPEDIYRWIHRESYRINTSKAKFIESVLRKQMNESTSNWTSFEVRSYANKS